MQSKEEQDLELKRRRAAGLVDEETPVSRRDVIDPIVVIVAALALFGILGYRWAGARGAALLMYVSAYLAGIQVVFGLITCFLMGWLFGYSFGTLKTAIPKLLAVFLFPPAVTFFVPFAGGIIALPLYFVLFRWFFDVEFVDVFYLSLVMFVIQLGAGRLMDYLQEYLV